MVSSRARIPLLSLLGLAWTAGCEVENKVDDSTPDDEECETPVANAGADQSVALSSTVTLDGSSSTVCLSDERTWSWTFEAVPTDSAIDDSALSDNKSATASVVTFTPDATGDYVLSLVVADGENTSSADIVVISVTTTDNAPVADCGGDKTGKAGESVNLDGSASFDPDGDELEYTWSVASAPSCSDITSTSIYDRAEAVASVIPDCDGIYVVSLVVSDGEAWSEPSLCSIDVASENRLPTADAGDSESLAPCNGDEIELDGYGSYDLDGDDLTYQWSLVSAPSDSAASDDNFNDSTSPEAIFSLPDDPIVTGDYTFQLQVYDGEIWSAPDIVTYTVRGTGENANPVANAGDDQSVEAEADCTTASYVWTCADCEGETLEVEGTGSYDPDDDDLRYYWTEATGIAEIALPTQPITDVTIPGAAATYGETSTSIYTIELNVYDDCDASDTDELTITYTCTGEAAS